MLIEQDAKLDRAINKKIKEIEEEEANPKHV